MTPSDFNAWAEQMKADRKWSERQCARELGCSQNSVRKWRKDDEAPRYIALACAALTYGLREWRQQ